MVWSAPPKPSSHWPINMPIAQSKPTVLTGFPDMMKHRYRHFRWTPRTAWISFVYMALVPGVLGYIGLKVDVSGLPRQ